MTSYLANHVVFDDDDVDDDDDDDEEEEEEEEEEKEEKEDEEVVVVVVVVVVDLAVWSKPLRILQYTHLSQMISRPSTDDSNAHIFFSPSRWLSQPTPLVS
nr:unnamed protein product [Spirometra erinaceieuropaei]